MQQATQREVPDRISWSRAMIFGVGFFFIAALLIGQIPSYINLEMTSSSLTGFEQGVLALGVICIAAFVIVQVIVMLFDPKPLIPPIIFTGLGVILGVLGLLLLLWASYTGNQYFPHTNVFWNPVLGGNVLWLEPAAIDLVMIGTVIMAVGVGMVFYSMLALRELRNPDRSDPGTTRTIRTLLIVGSVLLVAFMFFYTFVTDQSLAPMIYPQCPYAINAAKGCPGPFTGLAIIDTILNVILGAAIFCTLGAFALRLHYLMRPVRKRTMSNLYITGIVVAQVGAVCLLAWFVIYPLITWIHSWTFIGLGSYLTVCGKPSAVPQSCGFSQQAGYIIDAVITMNNFVLLIAAVAFWKTRRNLVVIAGVTTAALLALATLVTHMHPDELLIAMLVSGGSLILAVIWTSVARREFAVVGENNLGCLGQWLVIGTCLLIYLTAFAFFSIPGFRETNPNIPFVPGAGLNAGITNSINAVLVIIITGVLTAVQFYFLTRNRYKI
ncbi:MAG TPA: hypothetical protein VFA09_13465 [Ktedonobacteraceae bacterium]|nr:hypothetical protein [Ktedonobacteraceae bacterium]